VYCEEFNPAWSWYAGNAAATAVFELHRGARFVFDGSWCSDGHETSWNAAWRASLTNGTALWNGDDAPVVDLAAGTSVDPGGGSQPDGDGIGGTIREFAAALRTGRTPMSECHDNVSSLAMVHAAIASSVSGQRITIADILEKAHAEAVSRSSGLVRDVLTSWTSLTPPGRAAPR
jgi:predicted dehydrogenase